MNLSIAHLLYTNTSKDLSEKDYYPFGMVIPGRNFNSNSYRYGYQNQEMDNEIYGTGNALSFEYRVEDTRLGRFLSIDPLASKYPHNSPYAFSENRVIDGIELEGLEFLSLNNSGVNINEQQQNDDGTYNIKLGSETFNNVGVETFDGQQYFNLGKHLYYGDNGWSASGSETQRMTQWPDRPTLEDMWSNLPDKKIDAPNLIGGRVDWNFDNNPESFGNTCGIRMCRSLNYSGAKVSPTADEKKTGRAGTGSDKNWYYYGVNELGSYLDRTFGAPDMNINVTGTINSTDIQNQMQGRVGIIMFRVAGWDDAVGHFDMWNGSNAKNASYFNPNNATLTGVSIWFLDKQSQR